jgi:hypothetical protein
MARPDEVCLNLRKISFAARIDLVHFYSLQNTAFLSAPGDFLPVPISNNTQYPT